MKINKNEAVMIVLCVYAIQKEEKKMTPKLIV